MKNGGIDTQFYLRNWWFNFIRVICDSILFSELLIQFYFGIGDSILFSELVNQFYLRNW